MIKIIGVIITGFVTSLFLFPFQFTGLPVNTKLILAVGGLVVLGFELARGQSAKFDRRITTLSFLAIFVSICGIVSVFVNNTPDYSYAGYIMSMWVWLGAAYFVLKLMQAVHGHLNVQIVCNYLIAVSVAQCLASIIIDRNDGFRNFVDRYVQQGQVFLKNTVGVKRKYGIGANLDVAASRFSAVLVILSYLFVKANDSKKTILALVYLGCFLFISVQGNAIARTTTVGMLIGITCICVYAFMCIFGRAKNRGYALSIGAIVGAILISSSVYLYNTDEQFHDDMRFGFEGFFSLAERGSWEVASNDRLKTMYVWPDNLKTWLIGDGYFANPKDTDPYFVGEMTGGYYKGTDVGFLRFIFYFGIIGLTAFSAFMCYAAAICMETFRKYKWMFLMILAANFIIWLKVSTDNFVVFAPFLVLSAIDNKTKPQEA